jgi:acyl-CoA synthetase (AMP-forming)/AMP-acid ligase II
MTEPVNIAHRLTVSATRWPEQLAVVQPTGRDSSGRYRYQTWTFAQLEHEANAIANGLRDWGVQPGQRLVLMVRPSFEFIALTFCLLRAGVVVVLIDPGMGRSNIFRCLEEIHPDGFIAIPMVQAIRVLHRRRFPNARFNVTVSGHQWFWRGKSYSELTTSRPVADAPLPLAHSTAAIIFTSGSTGPPKGVVYEHSMFEAQVDLLRDFYGIQAGEVDLPGFPLFGLFNAAMGVTTVIPDMDPTRPARVDPVRILSHLRDWNVTQAFGSPAIWNRVGRYCEATGEKLPASLRRVLSAGAPVPVPVIERMRRAFTNPDADIHTPYGATESLPVASIDGRTVLEETAQRTRQGAGTCVGHPFPGIDIKIIRISDEPIASIAEAVELPVGEIGEIIVRGPSTTREYFQRPDATAVAKIYEGRVAGDEGRVAGDEGRVAGDEGRVAGDEGRSTNHPTHNSPLPSSRAVWHRLGDVGYLDEQGRLWFCGRKAHLVEAECGRMFTIPCEAIFNNHPRVFRSALVGVGSKPRQRPVIIVEPEAGQFPRSAADRARFREELRQLALAHPLTAAISTILFHRSLPVDIRHNVKIFREKLGPWAAKQLRNAP